MLLVASTLGCWGSTSAPASAQSDDPRERAPNAEPSMAEALLEAHAWEDRPIVVFAPDETDSEYRRQMEIFAEHREGLAERRNVVYRVFEKGAGEGPFGPLERADVEHLRSRFEPKGRFAVVLVGLDTTEKLRVTEPLSAEQLFETIDAMPMRKREIRDER